MTAEPAPTPVTTPVVLTLAIEGLLLLQEPPEIEPVNVVDVPEQTDDAPDIVPAVAPDVTVTVDVATDVPQLVVTE